MTPAKSAGVALHATGEAKTRVLKALAAGGIGWRWSLLDIGTGVLGVLVATGVLVEAVVMQALAQEAPLTVKEAARFLGVSPQTVYAWVERRQIPHLRVMGRNIRFLRSELSAFRATFQQEVENGTTEKA